MSSTGFIDPKAETEKQIYFLSHILSVVYVSYIFQPYQIVQVLPYK